MKKQEPIGLSTLATFEELTQHVIWVGKIMRASNFSAEDFTNNITEQNENN